ncbi:MAG TPA: HD domain-containing phosphohydrolase [Gemmatimonadaceae bacterium]
MKRRTPSRVIMLRIHSSALPDSFTLACMPFTPVASLKFERAPHSLRTPHAAQRAAFARAEAASRPEDSRGLRLVSLSEVLTALSYALDLTGGQAAGHTVRTCMIGMRIAGELGLPDDACASLYDALLLKDAGSSSNAAYLTGIYDSDDRVIKPRLRWIDRKHRVSTAYHTARSVGIGQSPWSRLTHFVGILSDDAIGRNLIQIRSDRGAKVALRLGFPRTTAHAIRSLDEQWDGCGLPDGKRGDEIPLLSRIANLAQTVEAFRARNGVAHAMRVARARRGRWFEPRLVDIVSRWENDAQWWARLDSPDVSAEVLSLKPTNHVRLVDERGIDDVARAFADIIDAKSPFTYNHSTRVANYACAIAERAGLAPEEIRRLRRASLLHDMGKLGISSRLLDKTGPLSRREREEMNRHPLYTWEVLSRVSAFSDFARMAAMHHEKLDGSGYPWGVRGEKLDDATRILCVADVFEALTSARSYRAEMTPRAALRIIRREAGMELCPRAVEGLAAMVEESPKQMVM